MGSQWQNFLRNLGEWRGSFASMDANGTLQDCTASILTLEALDGDQMVRFRLRRFADGDCSGTPSRDVSEDYRSLGRQVVFFDNGTFCKGTLQVAPGSSFGGEFGFVDGDRRHRLVQLHTADGDLNGLVLIREFRAGTPASEQPPLQAEQLIGSWHGDAATITADWPEPESASAMLSVEADGSGALQLCASVGQQLEPCEGRLLLLPDAGYHLSPLKVSHRSPFSVQAGWLPEPGRLECLIRRFDGTGAWRSSTQLRLRRS